MASSAAILFRSVLSLIVNCCSIDSTALSELSALCADDLSYSHSNGFLEDKAAFVANATDGKTEFLSITYKDPTIKIVGPAAIVRFHWLAEMMTGGQKVANNLYILMNWQKQGDDWKLLSRSATKM